MRASRVATTVILTALLTSIGCNGDGPSHADVNRGIDSAFQAPGNVAGAATAAGGNLAAYAVETPGNAVEDGQERFQDN